MTQITTKNSSTASAVPSTGDLVKGELAVNVADKKLYTKDAGGVIVEVGINPTTIDINAGTIDGTPIGATTPSTGVFTNVTSTALSVADGTHITGANATAADVSGSHTLAVGSNSGGKSAIFAGTVTADGLLVGTTISNLSGQSTTEGVAINTDSLQIARNNNVGLFVNRFGTDGEVLRISKDGASRGCIGVADGDTYISGKASNHAGLTFAYQSVLPNTIGVLNDNTVDLGQNGNAFKDLYLSGGAYLDGTATMDGLVVDGNVGIGTDSPSSKLDIVGSTTDAIRIRSDVAPENYYQIGRNQSTGLLEFKGSETTYNGYLFKGPTNDLMRIDGSTGNVGIGSGTSYSPLSILNGTDISMGAGATGQFNITGNGYGFGIALNATGAHLYTNSSSRPLILGVNGIERMRIDGVSGNVLVGTTSTDPNSTAGAQLSANGRVLATVDGGNAGYFNRLTSDGELIRLEKNGVGVGSISVTASATSYNTSSDYRLKEDWQPIANATETVMQLKPCNFAWKVDGTRVDGFLAHELQEVIPCAATGEKDGMRDEEYEVSPAVYEEVVIPTIQEVLDEEGNVITEAQEERTEQNLVSEAVTATRLVPDMQAIDQAKIVPLLTAALQQAITKIEELGTRITALEGV